MGIHDMCSNRVKDTDGKILGCMRSAGHWAGRVVPHYDASEDRSWVFDRETPVIWDGNVGRHNASNARYGHVLPREL